MHRFVVRAGLAMGLTCLGACASGHGAFVMFDMWPKGQPTYSVSDSSLVDLAVTILEWTKTQDDYPGPIAMGVVGFPVAEGSAIYRLVSQRVEAGGGMTNAQVRLECYPSPPGPGQIQMPARCDLKGANSIIGISGLATRHDSAAAVANVQGNAGDRVEEHHFCLLLGLQHGTWILLREHESNMVEPCKYGY